MARSKPSLTALRLQLEAMAAPFADPDVKPSPGDLFGCPGVYPMADAPVASPSWHRELARRILFSHLPDTDRLSEHLAARAELFTLVCNHKRHVADERRRLAFAFLSRHFELMSGLTQLLELERSEGHEPDADRIFSLADELVARPFGIRYLARVILVFTSSYRRLNPIDAEQLQCDEAALERLVSVVHRRWQDTLSHTNAPGTDTMVALPHGPMSTLPRESGHLGSLVRDGDAGWRDAAAKFHSDNASTPQQLVLVYDKRLVVDQDQGIKSNPSVMRVPIEDLLGAPGENKLDAPGALASAVVQIYKAAHGRVPSTSHLAGLTNDIPRVVAGMFLIAREDERRSALKLAPGTLLDSETAARLTRRIGLDHTQKRNRDRVRAVRAMLEHIELTRTVRDEAGTGSMTWTGPIIQRLRDRVEVSKGLPDGLDRSKAELGVWMIAPELWRMQDSRGPSASFMLLDRRAFELSSNTSEPFNLYWTIIQRAYNARRARNSEDQFDADGAFRPTFEVLYTWANLEKPTDRVNPHRLVSRLRSYLDLLVERELIVSYDTEFFERTSFSLKRDARRRIAIQLPPGLLGYLPSEAFISKQNHARELMA